MLQRPRFGCKRLFVHILAQSLGVSPRKTRFFTASSEADGGSGAARSADGPFHTGFAPIVPVHRIALDLPLNDGRVHVLGTHHRRGVVVACPVGTEERFTGSSEPSGCVEGFTSMIGLVARTMSSAMYHSPWSAVTTMVASSYKPSRLSSSRYSLTIWREPSPCSMAPVPPSTVSALRFNVYGGWGPARCMTRKLPFPSRSAALSPCSLRVA